MKKFMKMFGLAGLLAGMMMVAGCGGDDAAAPAASGPAGSVLQGAVSGATVVAKKAGSNDFSKAETGELTAKTGTDGKFKFQTVPTYAYTLVTLPDGTDILTGKKNVQLIAKAGSQYVTPLTTLVALNPAAEANLLALAGGTATSIGDVNISNTTPAALVLAKSIETAVAAMSETISKSAGTATITSQQLANVQSLTLQAIATQVAASTVANLSMPNTLTTAMNTAITTAIPTITNANTNITVTPANITAIATTVANNSVGSAVMAISAPAGVTTIAQAVAVSTPASSSAASVIAESSKITTATSAAIATAATTAVTAASAVTTVVVTPPNYNPPVVKTALAPAVISAVLTIPASGNATIAVKFNHAINDNGSGSVKIGTTTVAGSSVVSGDTITFTATSKPAADATLTVAISGYTSKLTTAEEATNISAAMSATSFDIVVPTVATGSTGSASALNIK